MIKKGYEMKLNIQPIYIGLVHKYFFEGPCRMAPPEQLTPEFEAMVQPMMGNGAMEGVKAHLAGEPLLHLNEMIYVQRDDEMTLPETLFEELMKNDAETDVYLVLAAQMLRGDVMVELGERTGKPIVMTPEGCCMPARALSHMRSHDLEGYAPLYWEGTISLLHALRLRKVMHNSNLLQVVRMGEVAGSDITSNAFYNQRDVTKKLGVRFRAVNIHEILDQYKPGDPMANPTIPGRMGLNPTEEEMKEIAQITEDLVNGATLCNMEKDKVEKTVRLWYTVQKFLDKHDCNMFVAPCPQLCATKRADKEQITFCLTHSLNNENGIPSACEMDAIAALSEQLLISVSGCASYMGETNPFLYFGDGKATPPMSPLVEEGLPNDDWKVGGLETEPNLMFTFHAVPNRKMRGLDKPNANYSIQPFAFSGWGATIRNDWREDKGTTITMCRLSPKCDKLFIAKGTVMGGAFKEIPNCKPMIIFQVKDNEDFYNKMQDFGEHIPLVYGDHTDTLRRYAQISGLEVVEA